MKLLVTGGRDFDDVDTLFAKLAEIHGARPITLLIHGAAAGADSIAALWAETNKVPLHPSPANWKKYDWMAGHRRNQEMVDLKPDLVLVCPGGNGTRDCFRRAVKAGLAITWL